MGLTTNDIKNHLNKPITFVKVFYIEDSTLKSYLFSDNFKKFSDGTSPEVRLINIPVFRKSFDPITNSVIEQSTYKIQLNNSDFVLDTLFTGNKIFNAQKVEFYITTEESSDELLVATALCENALIGSTIDLNLKEINELTKINTLNKFDSATDEITNEDLDEQPKKVVLGETIVKLENTNPITSSEWKNLGFTGTIKRLTGTNYYRLVLSDNTDTYDKDANAKFQRLRKSIFEGDQITIAGFDEEFSFTLASSLYYPEVFAFPGEVDGNYINLQIEKGNKARIAVYGSIIDEEFTIDGEEIIWDLTGDVLIKSADSAYYNDEFHVSDKVTKTYEETIAVSAADYLVEEVLNTDADVNALNTYHDIHEYSTSSNFIEISDDWSFLQENDRIQVVLQYIYSPTVFFDSTEEELVVDSYDFATKKIWFKEPDRISSLVLKALAGIETNYRVVVRYNNVSKIRVKDKDFELKKNYFDITLNTDITNSLEKYPSRAMKYNDAVNYTSGDAGIWSIIPDLLVEVKKNAHQIIGNIANVNRMAKDTGRIGYSDKSTLMNFAVSTFANSEDYLLTAKCRIKYVFDSLTDYQHTKGYFNNQKSHSDYSTNFFLLQIKSGVCTYQDLINLSDDINCPFVFSIPAGASKVPTDIIKFDAYSVSTTGHSTTHIHLSPTDLAQFAENDEIAIYDGTNFAIRPIDAVNTGSNRLEFYALPFTPADGAKVSKLWFIQNQEVISGNTTSASASNYLVVNYTDFTKFNVNDTILIKSAGNYQYAVILSKAYTSGEYRLTLSLSPGATHPCEIVRRKLKDNATTKTFKIPGYFSADVNVRVSNFINNGLNTNISTDYSLSNFDSERNADKLIRKQNERHKIFFTYYQENLASDRTTGVDPLYAFWQNQVYPTKTPENYLTDASNSFKGMNKDNYTTYLQNCGLTQKYSTVINLCPDFNLQGTDEKAWGGISVTDSGSPGSGSIVYGYSVGTTTDEKYKAMAQAIANKINNQIRRYFSIMYLSTYQKLPIVAVAMKNTDGWIVRVKHCSFNSAAKVNFDMWDNTANMLKISQPKINYSVFVPFVTNNNLYVKLDRKALSLAYNQSVLENYTNLEFDTINNEYDYVDTNSGLLVPGLQLHKNLYFGNGYQTFPVDTAGFNTALETNPIGLFYKYVTLNDVLCYNITIPNVYSRQIGSTDFEQATDLNRFNIYTTNSPLICNIDLLMSEYLFDNYFFKATEFDDTDVNRTDNQKIALSCDNYNILTSGAVNWAKNNYYTGTGTKYHSSNKITEWLELSASEDVYAYVRNKERNLAYIFEKVMSVYEITNYDSDALEAIRNLNILSSIVIRQEEQFYKTIQPLLEANNIVCFTNKNNQIVFEKLALIEDTAVESLSYYDCLDYSKKIELPIFTKVLVNYGKNELNTDAFKTQVILNSVKNSDFTTFNIKNEKKIEAQIVSEITDTNDLAILVQKYTNANEYLELTTNLSFITLELNDIISFEYSDGQIVKYCVCLKETNFATMKFKLIKCITA